MRQVETGKPAVRKQSGDRDLAEHEKQLPDHPAEPDPLEALRSGVDDDVADAPDPASLRRGTTARPPRAPA